MEDVSSNVLDRFSKIIFYKMEGALPKLQPQPESTSRLFLSQYIDDMMKQ